MDVSSQSKLATILVFIIIIGVLGNMLNIIVFSKKNMIKMTTFKFLFYLSIIDLFVLLVCTTDALLTFGFNIEIRLYSNFFCRWHSFFTYFLTHMSSVVLMVVSIERCLVISNVGLFESSSIKSRGSNVNLNELSNIESINLNRENVAEENQNSIRGRIKNKFNLCFIYLKRIEVVMILISILVALANIHCLFYLNLTIEPNDQYIELTSTAATTTTSFDYHLFVKNFKKIAISNSTNLTLNEYLLSINFKKKINYLISTTKSTQINQNETNTFYMCFPLANSSYGYFLDYVWIWIDVSIYSFVPSLVMVICSIIILVTINRKTRRFSSRKNSILKKRLTKRNNQLLLMLTATNLYFLLCTLPYCITYTKIQLSSDKSETSLIDSLVHIFAYSNNSVNFIFYTIFSQKYRQTFAKLFNINSTPSSKNLTSINHNENEMLSSPFKRNSHTRSPTNNSHFVHYINDYNYKSSQLDITQNSSSMNKNISSGSLSQDQAKCSTSKNLHINDSSNSINNNSKIKFKSSFKFRKNYDSSMNSSTKNNHVSFKFND
jgi:hypothetical protein